MARTRKKPVSQLTPKQQEVLALATEGMTADAAAAKLGIAVSGVYNHTKRIREHGHAIEWQKAATAAANNGGSTAPAVETTPDEDYLGHSIESFGSFIDGLRSKRGTLMRLVDEYESEIERLKTGIETAKDEIVGLDGQISAAEKISAELDEFGASTVTAA